MKSRFIICYFVKLSMFGDVCSLLKSLFCLRFHFHFLFFRRESLRILPLSGTGKRVARLGFCGSKELGLANKNNPILKKSSPCQTLYSKLCPPIQDYHKKTAKGKLFFT